MITNTLLEEYLSNPLLSDKDRYEIRQIFSIMPDEKKQNILDNFPRIIASIELIKEDLRETQEILLWRAISNIENAIKGAKNKGIKNWTSSSINELKNMM
jgi:adenylate kinase family enzyme